MGWIENRSNGWELNSRVRCPLWAATHRPRDRIPVRTRTPLSHRTSTPCVYLYLYTSPRAANRPCDGRHQKRECDTNFFVCLLVHRYRIDALPLPLVCFAPHCGSRTEFLPCVTDPLVNTRPGRRIAQAALKSCGSFEQRRDLGTCPTFIPLNVELVACRTSTRPTKQHERRCWRRIAYLLA